MDALIPANIEYRNVEIKSAIEVVKYGFIAQKSIVYLDLSTCELSTGQRYVNTLHAFRKAIGIDRSALYYLNLDAGDKIQTFTHKAELPCLNKYFRSTLTSRNALHLGNLHVAGEVYGRSIWKELENIIDNSTSHGIDLSALLKFLKLSEGMTNSYLFAHIIYEKILDLFTKVEVESETIVEYVKFRNMFYFWITSSENPRVMECVLRHARRMKHSLWDVIPHSRSPVNGSINERKLEYAASFLKYGYGMLFYERSLIDTLLQIQWEGGFIRNKFADNIRLCGVSPRRASLIAQYLYIMKCFPGYSQEVRLKTLRYIWRSIRDCYLTPDVMKRAFQDTFTFPDAARFVDSLCDSYQSTIVCENEDSFLTYRPRSLKHQCRLEIRKSLMNNYQIPDGIGSLGLPPRLEAYLNLEDYIPEASEHLALS